MVMLVAYLNSMRRRCAQGCSYTGSPMDGARSEQRMASANSFNGSADWYPCAALDFMDSVPLVRAGEAQAIAVTEHHLFVALAAQRSRGGSCTEGRQTTAAS